MRDHVFSVRCRYPVGSRIQLDYLMDDYKQLPRRSKGYVYAVDDKGIVHCEMDCGYQLGLIPGVDVFHRIGGSRHV